MPKYTTGQKNTAQRETDGLADRRGHRLKEAELSETQRLKREIEQLKKENDIKDQEIAFLKKVKELERMCLLDSQNKDK